MRLLDTETLQLVDFIGNELRRRRYAILSHTWGDGEILFDDVQRGKSYLLGCGKLGLSKMLSAARMARQNRYRYIWIDTCCIDKSSSAELSEAINSMWAWYQNSDVCYVYLSDFKYDKPDKLSGGERWFSRGWTLQELIAPSVVEFYNGRWVKFGTRDSLKLRLSSITGIEELVFRWHPYEKCPADPPIGLPGCEFCRTGLAHMLDSISIATRMTWAAYRNTTREEDVAYSMLGIFGVNMPLLYGEGQEAFQRLQHEIVRRSTDQSIFAFAVARRCLMNSGRHMGMPLHFLFAGAPFWFHGTRMPRLTDKHFRPGTPMVLLSNVGIQLDVYLAPIHGSRGFSVAVLSCSTEGEASCSPALILEEVAGLSTTRTFIRTWMVPSTEAPVGYEFQVRAGTGKAEATSMQGNL
jgi:hypothetical protein